MHPALAGAVTGNSDNFKAVSLALDSYLSGMAGSSITALSSTERANRLEQAGLSKNLVARIEACLAQGEMGRFGPQTDDEGWDLLARTDELLIDLDKAVQR